MSKTFRVITLGCKVNQYESAYISDALSQAGWNQACEGETADVSIINTCIVTQRAAHQSRQEIRKAVRQNPEGLVAAVGCYAQVYGEELSQIEGIGLVTGNTEKGRVPGLLQDMVCSGSKLVTTGDLKPGMPFEYLPVNVHPGRTRAYLKIQDGCEAFCSYCIVAFARGPYRSLLPEKVLSAIESLTKQGYREIVLTGIHLGKYGVDLKAGTNLGLLLKMIEREEFPARTRLSSLEPQEIDQDYIEMAASGTWLCRHFHIPLQSGDDAVLKRMNRHYTAQNFGELVRLIHKKIPLAAIGIDVMSGFPGEDSLAHDNTCALIKDLPVSYLHVFPFSPRRGTAAFDFKGRNKPDVIKQRAAELRMIGRDKRAAFYKSCIGKEFPVLVERRHSKEKGMVMGTSDNYLPVLFQSSDELKNRIVPVLIERVEDNRVFGLAI